MNSFLNEENRNTQALPSRNLAKERLQIAAPALGTVFIFVGAMVFQFLIAFLVALFAPWAIEKDWYTVVLSTLPMYLFAMPLSLFFYRLGKAEPPARKKMSVPVWLGLMAISFAMSYFGNFIGLFVNAILSLITGEPPVNDLQALTTTTPFWANLLFLGILAPIMEELFYRKLVIDRLRRYGDLPAILISGIAFGLIHGNFYQFFYAAMLGMFFGYIYLNTGKIRHTIFLHMGINLVGGVFASEMIKLLDLELLTSDPLAALAQNTVGVVMYLLYVMFIGAVFIGALVAAIILFLRKRKPLQKAAHPLTAREWVAVGVCNPAVWIFVLVTVLLFL